MRRFYRKAGRGNRLSLAGAFYAEAPSGSGRWRGAGEGWRASSVGAVATVVDDADGGADEALGASETMPMWGIFRASSTPGEDVAGCERRGEGVAGGGLGWLTRARIWRGASRIRG